mmetsp:Transcript_5779/g.16208  ORF Transcript_5779/g.16208 Transcript_5779/m.16208 type:complete len:200 (-) Transcript_5779:2078-2677(-)
MRTLSKPGRNFLPNPNPNGMAKTFSCRSSPITCTDTMMTIVVVVKKTLRRLDKNFTITLSYWTCGRRRTLSRMTIRENMMCRAIWIVIDRGMWVGQPTGKPTARHNCTRPIGGNCGIGQNTNWHNSSDPQFWNRGACRPDLPAETTRERGKIRFPRRDERKLRCASGVPIEVSMWLVRFHSELTLLSPFLVAPRQFSWI